MHAEVARGKGPTPNDPHKAQFHTRIEIRAL
jgi:hypothetical protein